jgi:hypothetical protein
MVVGCAVQGSRDCLSPGRALLLISCDKARVLRSWQEPPALIYVCDKNLQIPASRVLRDVTHSLTVDDITMNSLAAPRPARKAAADDGTMTYLDRRDKNSVSYINYPLEKYLFNEQ